MRIQRIILAIFVVFFFQLAIGQGNDTEKEYKKEKTKQIKMPKYYKAFLPKKAIAISTIQVLQAVPDSTRLGFVQRGMANQKVIAVPAEDMTAFLQKYINKQYENDYKKEGVKLLLLVKNLRINERTFYSSERAFARLHADSYLSIDGVLYNFLTTVDTVQVGGGLDVTAFHGENIAAALHKLIVQSLKIAENNSAPGEWISLDSLVAKVKTERLHPIQETNLYNGGVYLTFREFLLNSPSLKNYRVEVESNGMAKIISVRADSSETEIQPWGLCNKGEIYKCHQSMLVPIEKYGKEFMISYYIDKANRRNRNLYGAAFTGGILGGAVGGAIWGAFANSEADRLLSVTSIPYITSKQPEASVIDMKTGEFTF